jgi:hypothetical protein
MQNSINELAAFIVFIHLQMTNSKFLGSYTLRRKFFNATGPQPSLSISEIL